ncbi:MAG: CBS domain-containing protein [Aquificaceae bacterium]|uniref:CBS domain-containing protein n=1 Tax=Pampinifervens florentissimum TaxID=1632019 RepID=UPI0013B484BA|nr:CBS domain-containing protein [Hydrogenobacter sp. T-8]QID33722.1 CBS domain-containing protein [Hydrogenobacter sp. T-8]
MSVKNFARKEVITLKPDNTVYDAVRLMKEKNVGSVVIVDDENKPIGIITDRDVVVRVVYNELDVKNTLLEKVMTRGLSVLDENMGLFEALRFMKDEGVRRYPVVDSEGKLTGFFSLDDVLFLLGKELAAVADIIAKESPNL